MDNNEQVNELIGVLKAIYAVLEQPVQYSTLEDNVENSHKKIKVLRGDCDLIRFIIRSCLERNTTF
jgi:hypothetical protein